MATLTQTRAPLAPADRRRGLRLFDPGGGRSLDQAVMAVLETASAGGSAGCLVCGAAVGGSRGEGIECASCHSTLE